MLDPNPNQREGNTLVAVVQTPDAVKQERGSKKEGESIACFGWGLTSSIGAGSAISVGKNIRALTATSAMKNTSTTKNGAMN